MFNFTNLIPALDAIEAFGFWLKHAKPGWSISSPAVERLPSGEQYPIFVLYEKGVSVGVYETPLEALAKISDDKLTAHYHCLTSESYEQTFRDEN